MALTWWSRVFSAPLSELRLAALQSHKDAEQSCWPAGQAPVTWADLIVIGAKVATLLEWNEIKEKRNPKGEGGVSVANLFGAEWQIQLGREDATQPDPEVSIPTTDSSVDEIRVSFSTFSKVSALRSSVLAPRPPFPTPVGPVAASALECLKKMLLSAVFHP